MQHGRICLSGYTEQPGIQDENRETGYHRLHVDLLGQDEAGKPEKPEAEMLLQR